MGGMDRIIDRAIVLACCALGLAVTPWDSGSVVALLAAIATTTACDLAVSRWRLAPAIAYAVAAAAMPPLATFLPLSTYDLARAQRPWLRFLWAIPLAAAAARAEFDDAASVAAIAFGCAVAFLLCRRAERTIRVHELNRRQRDEIREGAIALEAKYAELADRQDLDVKLATLKERSRIAREIHDNVGHLLTRAVLQVNALQVTHRDDNRIVSELAAVGETVGEALDAVRASVHDLHDEGFDLETQLRAVAAACEGIDVRVDYSASDVPEPIGYSFLAIAREALSNTARHSDATRAHIAVTEHPGFFRLVAKDNGTATAASAGAFAHDILTDARDAADSRARAGIGLATMRDRAAALGGTFRVSNAGGFTVFVSVPKATAQEAHA